MMLLSLVPYALFGVTWYRLNLLGPQAGAPKLAPTWSRQHTQFFSYVLGFTLLNLAVAPFYLSAAVPDSAGQVSGQAALIALAMMVGVGYLTARLSFVFPAISVGETYSLKQSWRHTASQGWRLLGAMIPGHGAADLDHGRDRHGAAAAVCPMPRPWRRIPNPSSRSAACWCGFSSSVWSSNTSPWRW